MKFMLYFSSIIVFIGGIITGTIYHETADISKSSTISISKFADLKRGNLSFENILINNAGIVITCIFGSLFLSAPTLITLFKNGFVLGFQTAHFLSISGFLVFAYVLPHGIFEIPAIIIAGAAGFKIPYEIIRYLAGKKEQILTREDIREYLTLALISIILIVIAAWIEANVTLKIAKAILKSNIKDKRYLKI